MTLQTPEKTYQAEQPFLPQRQSLGIVQSLAEALAALRANKLRALLTALGIIIGVAAVIIMLSIGQGASASVSQRLQGLGTNLLTVSPGSANFGVQSGAGTSQTLTESDAQAIDSSVPNLVGVSPTVNGPAQVVYANQNWQTRVQAVYPIFPQINNWQISTGDFFTDQDETSARTVAVIGPTVKANLFDSTGTDPLGQVIRIRNVPFVIVGVLASKGSGSFGQDQDDVIFVPFKAGQDRIFGASKLSSIVIQVDSAANMTPAQNQITDLLNQRHRIPDGQPGDYTIRNVNDIIQTAQGITATLTLLLGGVAAVSLVVGGIGIMNIMLVAVTERTREIGIRMAIGARTRDILMQFLIEALVLSIGGGLIGILIGVTTSVIMANLAHWSVVVSYNSIMLSFGFAALIGIFFGFYPAQKASKLDPIVALRVD